MNQAKVVPGAFWSRSFGVRLAVRKSENLHIRSRVRLCEISALTFYGIARPEELAHLSHLFSHQQPGPGQLLILDIYRDQDLFLLG